MFVAGQRGLLWLCCVGVLCCCLPSLRCHPSSCITRKCLSNQPWESLSCVFILAWGRVCFNSHHRFPVLFLHFCFVFFLVENRCLAVPLSYIINETLSPSLSPFPCILSLFLPHIWSVESLENVTNEHSYGIQTQDLLHVLFLLRSFSSKLNNSQGQPK